MWGESWIQEVRTVVQPWNRTTPANVSLAMAVNPDPKPGRWILPLVILGMITFTYYFVSELPGASPDTTLPGAGSTTTTVAEDTTTSSTTPQLDPAVQANLDEIDEINAALQLLRTDLVTANTGFDASPRQIEYPDAVIRFTTVRDQTAALLTRFDASTAPEGFEENHTALRAALEGAVQASASALAGLTSSDPGAIRRAGVTAYVDAAAAFETEVTNTHTAATGS